MARTEQGLRRPDAKRRIPVVDVDVHPAAPSFADVAGDLPASWGPEHWERFSAGPPIYAMPTRAGDVCIRASSASNSLLSVSSLTRLARDNTSKRSIDMMTAFGASCFVITTVPPRVTLSRTRAKSFFASVAVKRDASSGGR